MDTARDAYSELPTARSHSFRDAFSKQAIHCTYLGVCSYQAARAYQERSIEELLHGDGRECVIFCEHPPTLTLGPRTKPNEIGLSLEEWKRRGVDVLSVDRGGGPTFHGPGQLVMYPVLNLRSRGVGVRRFVQQGLEIFRRTLEDLGLSSVALENPAGLWVLTEDFPLKKVGTSGRKLGSVGLRIRAGVSNHGFSLNVDCALEPFECFTPCGLQGIRMSSIAQEHRNITDIWGRLFPAMSQNLEEIWCSSTNSATKTEV